MEELVFHGDHAKFVSVQVLNAFTFREVRSDPEVPRARRALAKLPGVVQALVEAAASDISELTGSRASA